MGERIGLADWSSTPLGPSDAWPQSLLSALSICLHSRFPTAIYWGDEFRLLYNDAWSHIPGERHPAALGQPAVQVWSDIWHVIEAQFRQVYVTGEGFTVFDQMLPMVREGEVAETYWNYSLSPIHGEDGTIVGIFNQGHETTDRVMAERRSRAELDRLNQMFAQAPGFAAVLRGPTHVFELTNAAYGNLIGHRDVLGMPVRDALPDIDGQGYFEILDKVFATGETFVGSALPVNLQAEPGGPIEPRFVDLVYQPITDDAGRVSGIFVQGHDVTDRVLAEREVRESEARFRALIEHAPDKMWINHADGAVAYFNNAWRDYTGHPITPEGLSWTEAFHPDDRGLLVSKRNAGIAAGVAYEVEARMRRIRDGAWRWHLCRVAPLKVGSEIVNWAGMATDIDDVLRARQQLAELNQTLESRVTERTDALAAAHEQLRQSQKMEAIGQLTGGLAHDLNNMLTVISGNLDLARRNLDGADPAKVERSLANAMRGADSAAALTKRLLAFARRQPLAPRSLDPAELVLDMSELLRRSLGELIDLQVVAKAGAATIHADGHALENAILNLAVNARDAMSGVGKLTISVERVSVPPVQAAALEIADGGYVLVQVTDTGSGMDAVTVQRAVDPFFTTKEQGKGTGLGLSMVYGFMKQSGGALSIHSLLGEGTKVRLFFPLADTAPDQEPADGAAPAMARAPSGSILIVEDQEDVALLAASMLREAGYQVHVAPTGDEALRILDGLPHLDLVFSDLVMPGSMNGKDLARELVRRRPGLKVLLTTGYSPEAIERSSEFTYLSKPYRMDDLLTKMASVLGE